MKITEERLVKKNFVTDCICNLCGNSLKFVHLDTDPSFFEFHGVIDITAHGSYYSKFPGDGEIISFSLCQDCLKDLVSKFKIPAENKNYIHSFGDKE